MKPAFLCNRKLRCNFLLHKKAPRGCTDRNLVSEHGGKTDKTYTYNESNKLITATVTNGNDVTIESYTYDYEGNHVTKQINEDNKNSITDTYCYDAYGNLLQKTGDTENDYLYTGEQYHFLMASETTILDLTIAMAKGLIVQTLITCMATALFGELAASILKVVGIAQDTIGFVDAVKIGDPEEILVAALRLAVSVFTLKCQCFTGDTLVSTEDGDRRIDEIQAGDYVWAYNTETGERELKKVLSTPVTETDILVHVGLSDGTEIQTTMLHPFYVKTEDGGDWVAASNLTKGDEVLTEDGRVVYVENVQVEKLDKKIKVYNLEIEDLHTYFVAGGVLVHNKCIGENGTQTSSTTTGQNGKTERIDVENPSPGKRNGNIHYHEPNNRKWYYDFGLDKFIDEKTGELAPKKIQKMLQEPWVKKAMKKAFAILGEKQ